MTPEFHPLAEAELNDAAGFYEAAAVGLAMAHQRREPQYRAGRLG